MGADAMNLAAIGVRLRELDENGKLDKLLGESDDSMPWADIVEMLQWPAMIGIAIHVWQLANLASATKASPPPAEIGWLFLLVLVALGLRYGSRFLRTQKERLRRRLRRRGLVVPATLVQANNGFFEPDNDKPWPATVLVSFDPTVVDRAETLARVGNRVFGLKRADRRTLSPEHAALAWDLYHEMGPTKVLPVPADLTEGLRDCVLVSVTLPAQPLEIGPSIVCLALPGESSPIGVAVLPASIAAT